MNKKRGRKAGGKVTLVWSHNFAYAIGLLASDGCLQNDGRHIDLTSNDREQLLNFRKAIRVPYRITHKNGHDGKNFRIQFSEVRFYRFLVSLGFMPAKSKIIAALAIPPQYFFDFLRGVLDGDGCFYSYYDPRWRSSFMFYLVVASASPAFVAWLRAQIKQRLDIEGHVTKDTKGSTLQLKYAKSDSLKIIKKVYYNPTVLCLSRKRRKILKALKSQGIEM